jgi:asparagine synthase (glutamine-hydrolysing)
MLETITRWGILRSLSNFIGMFAIALFDRRERKLHLIRYRVAEKPLYYGWFFWAFLLGSELKVLRKYPVFAGDIDRDVLALYLSHMAFPDLFTIYEPIYKVQPDWMVTLDLGSVRNYPNRVWLIDPT